MAFINDKPINMKFDQNIRTLDHLNKIPMCCDLVKTSSISNLIVFSRLKLVDESHLPKNKFLPICNKDNTRKIYIVL